MTGKFYLLLERYWPIFSWLFQSRRCKASTLPSLMKERLWFTASLVGQSDAISRKNLQKCKVIRISKTRHTHIYVWIKSMWSNFVKLLLLQIWRFYSHMWLSLNETRRDKEIVGLPFLIPGYSFRVGSEVRQRNLNRWDFV